MCEAGTEKWMRVNSRPVKELKYRVEEGVVPEKEYILRVRAINAVGVSEPSDISENVFAKESDCENLPSAEQLSFPDLLNNPNEAHRVSFFSFLGNPTLDFQTLDLVVVETEKLHIPVPFRAVPSPRITWHKDGKELKADERLGFRSVQQSLFQDASLFNRLFSVGTLDT